MKQFLLTTVIIFYLINSQQANAQAIVSVYDTTAQNLNEANRSNNTMSIALQSKDEDEISIYPNPAQSQVNILFSENAGIKNIAIYNLIGNIINIYKVTGSSAGLNIDNLPSGVYFLRLTDAHGDIVATRRFTHQ